jgi:hypothetical protein
MTITDLKIYGLNGIAMALNFSSAEVGLKLILTLVVIGYTMQKWYLMNRDKNNKNEDNK